MNKPYLSNKVIVGLFTLVAITAGCAAFGNNASPPKKKHPTEVIAVCLEVAPTFCKKISECDGMPYGACMDQFENMCAVSTHIRDVDAIYDKCLPALETATCDALSKNVPDACKEQISSIDSVKSHHAMK